MRTEITHSSPIQQLRREASQLYRLVEQVEAFIRSHRASFAYPTEAELFFDYLQRTATSTKAFLQRRIAADPSDSAPERGLTRLRGTVVRLTGSWSYLHDFVKPLLDAHALRVPGALLRLLNYQVRTLHSLASTNIVVEVGESLNYLHRRQDRLQEAIMQLHQSLRLKELPAFINDLGIIGLPYSQGDALFLNCLLFHELGHYVYQKRGLEERVDEKLRCCVKQHFDSIDDRSCEFVAEKMHPWCEEVFCDLFAVQMIGPVYTFVFLDLLGLLGALETNDIPLFSSTHPSDAVRVREQVVLLKRLGWWSALPEAAAPSLRLIEEIAETERPESPYCEGFVLSQIPGLVGLFEETTSSLQEFASEVTRDRGSR